LRQHAFRTGALVAGVLLALGGPGTLADRPAAATFVCDDRTPFAILGVDTSEGRILLATESVGRGAWIVEAAPRTDEAPGSERRESAHYHPAPEVRPFAGSFGPGPVFALTECGRSCLQAVRWEGGAWAPLGEPLLVPRTATAHTTYDGGGTPWVVLQRVAQGRSAVAGETAVEAWAYRLDGTEWRSAGSLTVYASSASEAVPASGHDDAIVSGTGRFAAGEPPETWLRGLPKLGAERRGVLVPVGVGGAAYVTGDGSLFLSTDAGASWARSRWSPWGRTETRIWSPGQDYEIDVPAGDRRGPLSLVWFDRRYPDRQRILLTEWSPASDFRVLSEMAPEVSTLNEQQLPFTEMVLLGPGSWALLTGCVNTANGPGLVLRTYGRSGLSRPRFLPLGPAAPPRPEADEGLAPLPR